MKHQCDKCGVVGLGIDYEAIKCADCGESFCERCIQRCGVCRGYTCDYCVFHGLETMCKCCDNKDWRSSQETVESDDEAHYRWINGKR